MPNNVLRKKNGSNNEVFSNKSTNLRVNHNSKHKNEFTFNNEEREVKLNQNGETLNKPVTENTSIQGKIEANSDVIKLKTFEEHAFQSTTFDQDLNNDMQLKKFYSETNSQESDKTTHSGSSLELLFEGIERSSIISSDLEQGGREEVNNTDETYIRDTSFMDKCDGKHTIYDYVSEEDDVSYCSDDISLPPNQDNELSQFDKNDKYRPMESSNDGTVRDAIDSLELLRRYLCRPTKNSLQLDKYKRPKPGEEYFRLYWDFYKAFKIMPRGLYNEIKSVSKSLYKIPYLSNQDLWFILNTWVFDGTILNIVPKLIEFLSNLIKSDRKLSKESYEMMYLNKTKLEAQMIIDIPTEYPTFTNCPCDRCRICSEKVKTIIIPKIGIKEDKYRVTRHPFTTLHHYFQSQK